MKKLAWLVGVVFVCATAANAALVVKDTFTAPSYPTALVGHAPEIGAPWVAHSGAGTVPIQIIADHPPVGADGSAYLSQTTGREDDNTVFAGGEAAGAGSKYWAGFCVKVTGTDPLSNVYFAHFKDSGTFNFVARVGVTDPTVTDFQFGLFNASSTLGATWPTPILYSTWHRIVTAYTFDSGLQEMWVDPDPTKGPYDVGQVTPISMTLWPSIAIQAYAFRQGGSVNSFQTVDNLAVGNNIADWPTIASPCIPEPASLALLGLAALMIRRR